MHWSCRMDTEERLRRRRERYRLRRDRETPEEAKSRRRRNSDYMRRRRSAMTAEQRRLERTRNVQLSTPQSSPLTLNREANDPRKIWKFHTCLTCCSKSANAINRRCNNDEHISADNKNIDPPEFTVSYALYCFLDNFDPMKKNFPCSNRLSEADQFLSLPLHIKM